MAEASLRAAEESLAEKEREIESVSLKLRESDADLERLTKGKRYNCEGCGAGITGAIYGWIDLQEY